MHRLACKESSKSAESWQHELQLVWQFTFKTLLVNFSHKYMKRALLQKAAITGQDFSKQESSSVPAPRWAVWRWCHSPTSWSSSSVCWPGTLALVPSAAQAQLSHVEAKREEKKERRNKLLERFYEIFMLTVAYQWGGRIHSVPCKRLHVKINK